MMKLLITRLAIVAILLILSACGATLPEEIYEYEPEIFDTEPVEEYIEQPATASLTLPGGIDGNDIILYVGADFFGLTVIEIHPETSTAVLSGEVILRGDIDTIRDNLIHGHSWDRLILAEGYADALPQPFDTRLHGLMFNGMEEIAAAADWGITLVFHHLQSIIVENAVIHFDDFQIRTNPNSWRWETARAVELLSYDVVRIHDTVDIDHVLLTNFEYIEDFNFDAVSHTLRPGDSFGRYTILAIEDSATITENGAHTFNNMGRALISGPVEFGGTLEMSFWNGESQGAWWLAALDRSFPADFPFFAHWMPFQPAADDFSRIEFFIRNTDEIMRTHEEIDFEPFMVIRSHANVVVVLDNIWISANGMQFDADIIEILEISAH